MTLRVAAQQVAGADLAVESPFEAGLAFVALQVKFGRTAPVARRLSSTVSRPAAFESKTESKG